MARCISKAFVIGLLMMVLFPSRLLAVEVLLQPAVAQDGDIVELILQYESEIPSLYALDTEPLLRDFEVINTDSRIQRLTGFEKQRLRMEWIVQITPRITGRLEIPSLRLGEMQSQPIWLEVRPRTTEDRRQVDVRIELEAEPTDPYVGQQVVVTMRLLSNVLLNRGRIAEPAVEQGSIYRSTRDRVFTENRGDTEYEILERRISLFAPDAGNLQLGEAVFTGTLAGPGSRQLIRRSESLQLQVRSAPSTASSRFWLPASQVDMQLDWDAPEGNLQVGDSLGLELRIKAQGIPANALPTDLLSQERADFRIYPDEAKFSDQFIGSSIVGELRQSFVFVPSRAGKVTVPPVNLSWWDVNANSAREIRLPGRDIEVQELTALINETTDRKQLVSPEQESAANWFKTNVVWLLAVLALIVGLWVFRLPIGRRLIDRLQRIRRLRQLERLLKQACLRGDPHNAREILLRWANLRWPHRSVIGLSQVSDGLGDSRFNSELDRLDAALYAGRSDSWSGRQLWERFERLDNRSEVGQLAGRSLLPRIYPENVSFRPDSSL